MTTPDNGKNLLHSLNFSYLYLLATAGRDGFTAIVADDNTGHYSSLSAAVTAGEKFIFMKDGAYAETADIVLEGVTIIGQSAQGVQLSLTDCTIQMNDLNNSTTAGTARFTNNDKTVNGAGTAFNTLTSTDPNKYIGCQGMFAEIDSIAGATSMELFAKFFGPTLDRAGATYTLNHITLDVDTVGCRIENLTIIHILTGADNALEICGLRTIVRNVHFESITNNGNFIACPRAASEGAALTTIDKCRFEGGVIGIVMYTATYTRIVDCDFFGQSEDAIELNDDTEYTTIEKCRFSGLNLGIQYAGDAIHTNILNNRFYLINNEAIDFDGRAGAELYAVIRGNIFDECNPAQATPAAIHLDADWIIITENTFIGAENPIYLSDVQNCVIANNHFKWWGGWAINFNHTDLQRYVKIIGNTFTAESGETETGINFDGTNNIIEGNTFLNIDTLTIQSDCLYSIIANNSFRDCGDPIQLLTGGTYQRVIGNTIFSSTNGISVQSGADSADVSHNAIVDDTAIGIQIASDFCTVSDNRVENCTGNNIQIDATADRIIITSNLTLNSGAVNLVNNGTNTSVGNNIVA